MKKIIAVLVLIMSPLNCYAASIEFETNQGFSEALVGGDGRSFVHDVNAGFSHRNYVIRAGILKHVGTAGGTNALSDSSTEKSNVSVDSAYVHLARIKNLGKFSLEYGGGLMRYEAKFKKSGLLLGLSEGNTFFGSAKFERKLTNWLSLNGKVNALMDISGASVLVFHVGTTYYINF